VIDITGAALADDGRLDAAIFSGRGLAWVVATATRIALHRAGRAPGIDWHRLTSLDVLTPGLPVQIDGEYLGETPMSFTVAPKALSVLLPPGAARRLLGAADVRAPQEV
jgi:diacylglycerol kinase family enzyme